MNTERLDIRMRDISGSRFEEVKAESLRLDNVSLAHSHIHNANMSGMRLDDVNLTGAAVTNANLSGIRMQDANLSHATIDHVHLFGTEFRRAVLPQACDGNYNADGVYKPVSFVDCELPGAQFIGCDLSGVDIRNCQIGGLRINGIAVEELLQAAADERFRRKVEIAPPNADWPTRYGEEAEKLQRVLGPELVAVHHIGSTSIPGMPAKPIIDVLVEVRNIEAVDAYNDGMRRLGYQPKGENGIPLRRYFNKGGAQRTHHVHVFQTGSGHVTRHLAFRDYLTAHPEEAKRYADLKIKLARQFPADMNAYIEGKDALAKELEAKALDWQAGEREQPERSTE
ncbi:GrpB family protein [Paenibacillus xanthanilyticus]|uniref:GrpB family protein n=1 Tax=Paenibacillus xanthanilyticus TaxID=1783531 RepID=A0ABV8K3Y0_9BACL